MKSTSSQGISLRGADVVVDPKANETERLAAQEMARYLMMLTGKRSRIVSKMPRKGVAVALTSRLGVAREWETPVCLEEVGGQGFRLRAIRGKRLDQMAIVACRPVGVLYGVYALLEEMGMGFYFSGDMFPDREASRSAVVAADLDMTRKPAFAARGNMLHYNFVVGCTTWGLEDYKFYFDQLARMRSNLLLMHWYDDEPGGAYEVNGEYRAGNRAPNSMSLPWGAVAKLRTSEFSFGTGAFFDEEIFSSPPGETTTTASAEIKQFESVFSEATRYAKRLGVGVAAGFEEPRSDPTNPEVERHFRARVSQFLARNPHLTYFALWQHEGGGCVGNVPPDPGTSAYELFQSRRESFAYLGHATRVWEAIRYGRFAEIAYEVVRREAPRMKMVLVGWGGDRWMLFADYCLGYHRLLPADVIFTCHDNIDASLGPAVSAAWGELPPERERWAMPWVENDINDCWVRQPHVESLRLLAPDALRKGCQGLLTLHWRTKDVEEEAGYAARFAWDPALTPERFYRRMAGQAFGSKHEQFMARRLLSLQRLGARWTGVHGAGECTRMGWTGWAPHIPFELDGAACLYLREFALKARDSLAEIPTDRHFSNTDEGMYHMRKEETAGGEIQKDMNRPGVKEYGAAADRLLELSRETDPEVIREGLHEIEESILSVRPSLVRFGIPPSKYGDMDVFWLRLHHVRRNGGVQSHYAALERLRREFEQLAAHYRNRKEFDRLERLNSLAATMDFGMTYDRAAMLMAADELFEKTLVLAEEAKQKGDALKASSLAGETYERIVNAGLQDAVLALTRKLTTRCDFGVLATVNIKALPFYWQTLGRLEMYLTAVPPREVQAWGDGSGIYVEWVKSPRAAGGYNLYRRKAGQKIFKRIHRNAIQSSSFMYVDRPVLPGLYEYAVRAIDEQGTEGPISHRAQATSGKGLPPQIVASKPASIVMAGQPLSVRVVVVAERPVTEVLLHYRMADEKQWTLVPMLNRFRNSYHVMISGSDINEGVLLFYVKVRDRNGQTACWPATTTQELPWSISVVS